MTGMPRSRAGRPRESDLVFLVFAFMLGFVLAGEIAVEGRWRGIDGVDRRGGWWWRESGFWRLDWDVFVVAVFGGLVGVGGGRAGVAERPRAKGVIECEVMKALPLWSLCCVVGF